MITPKGLSWGYSLRSYHACLHVSNEDNKPAVSTSSPFSCHDRKPYLASPRAASIFEHSLESMRSKYHFQLLGYVVMPEHVHLLLSEPPTHPLSTVLGSLKRSVSKHLPESPFWLSRYHDFNVFSPEKRVEKLRHMHRNPVTRGLASVPTEYAWSSFNTYATRTQGPVQIDTQAGAP
jgi:putative transposase